MNHRAMKTYQQMTSSSSAQHDIQTALSAPSFLMESNMITKRAHEEAEVSCFSGVLLRTSNVSLLEFQKRSKQFLKLCLDWPRPEAYVCYGVEM